MMFLRDFDPLVWVIEQSLLTIAWLLALGFIGLTAFGFEWDRRARQRSHVPASRIEV